jgi:regulator of RNase E activity RraA
MELINELVMPVIGCVSVFGTIITVSVVRARTKLRLKEYQLEEMRLANEARAMEIEEQRVRLALADQRQTGWDGTGR